MIKRSGSRWLADIQPGGRGKKRFRKTFDTHSEAKRWEYWITHKISQNPDWEPKKRDTRSLQKLILIWWDHHGRSLKDGEKRKNWMLRIALEMNNPKAYNINASTFTTWRAVRLDANNKPTTLNNALAYFKALFNELIRVDEWPHENPFSRIRRLPVDEEELTFLSPEEIQTLLAACNASSNPDTVFVARICLATGARWSEAEKLRLNQLRKDRITFDKTKSGKKRSIPIAESIYKEVIQHSRPETGSARLFSNCYSAFREAAERSRIDLPEGQLTHVLRHTFASHFMINGGNILSLQRALGHGSLQMTMRYAHLAPNHLEEVIKLNPLTLC
ncbi:MAG: tyrosine-type recombinase/integrase [Sedimenticola sp.]